MGTDVGDDLNLRQPLLLARRVVVSRTRVLPVNEARNGPRNVLEGVHQRIFDRQRRLKFRLVLGWRHRPLSVSRHLELNRTRLANFFLWQS